MKHVYFKSGQFSFRNGTEKVRSQELDLYKWIERFMDDQGVAHFIPCCTASTTSLPIRYNPTTQQVEFYNGSVWANTSTGGNGITGLTAFAGGGQSSATALVTGFNEIAVCATAGDSVKLPTAVAGIRVTVFNDGAAPAAVFPATSGTINDGSANASVPLLPGQTVTYTATSATNWESSSQTVVTGNMVNNKQSSVTKSSTATLTAAELSTGLLIWTGGAATVTLPTATTIGTQLQATKGTTFDFVVDNAGGSGTVTIAVNTGIVAVSAVTGGTTLTLANSATNGSAGFRLTFISATAAILSRIY